MRSPLFCTLSAPSNSATQYSSCHDVGKTTGTNTGQGWNATEPKGSLCRVAGKVVAIAIRASSAPGSGKSWTITLRVNGVDSSSIVGVLSDAQTEVIVYGSEAIADGDWLTLKCVPSSTPTAPSWFNVTLGFESTTAGQQPLMSGAYNLPGDAGRGVQLNGLGNTSGGLYDIGYFGVAGVLSKFTIYRDAAFDANESVAVDVSVGPGYGTGQGVSCTINSSTQQASDDTHTVNVAAGDQVRYALTHYNGSTRSVRLGCVFTPTTSGQANAGGWNQQDAGAAGEIFPLATGTGLQGDTTLGRAQMIAPFDLLWKNLTIEDTDLAGDGTPGAGQTYFVTGYLGSVATALVATLTEGVDEVTDSTHTIAVGARELLSYKNDGTGSPWKPFSAPFYGAALVNTNAGLRLSSEAQVGLVQGSSPYSFNAHVLRAHSSILVLVSDNGTADPSGVTYNGTAATKLADASKSVTGLRTTAWLLKNPTTGLNAVQVTLDASASKSWACAYVVEEDATNDPAEDVSGGATGAGVTSISTTLAPAAGSIGFSIFGESGDLGPDPVAGQFRKLKSENISFHGAATSKATSGSSMGWETFDSGTVVQSVVWLKSGASAGGVTVTGGVASCGFTAIVGTATEAAASASGVVAAAALSAISGTTVEAAASASGVAAALALSAVVGTATEAAASAAGAIASFTLSAIAGSTTLAAASATGVVAAFALSPVDGTATEAAASASGAIAQFAFDAVPGTTNTGGVYVSGEIAGVVFDAIAGTSSAAAAGAAGLVASTTFDAVAGSVALPATSAAGAIAQLAFGAVGGETLTVAPDPRPTRSITVGNVWSVTAGGARSATAGEVRTHSVGVRSETR